MGLIPAAGLLKKAEENKCAIAAFNIENMETAQAVIQASDEENMPVIIQTTPSSIKYTGLKSFYHIVTANMEHTAWPVVLHLDHGSSFELAVRAIREGYSSVMIDGSLLSLEDNIALTKKVVDVARAAGVSVEAELGSIGGKEDDLEVEKSGLTDPDDAAYFVEKTGVDSLAVAIGTAHGIYKGTPKLDFERLEKIRQKVDIPLVLHGTSGVPVGDVQKCIGIGISKVNYATDLRVAFTNAVKKAIAEKPDNHDPKYFLKAGRDAVCARARELIRICNQNNCRIR